MNADSWLSTTLGKVAEFGNGGAWNQDEYAADGIRVVRVSDVKGDTLDLSECKYLSMAALDRYGRHQLRTGDLIICTVGSHPTQPASVVGRAVVVPKFADGALLNQNAVRVRPAVPYVHAGWLGFLGRSRRFHEYIIGCAGGAASQVRMPIGLLKEMPISVPPLSTQRRIASILSAYDDLIENNTRRIAILEEMARRIFEEWFVRFRFPGHESVRMVESELGLVPEGWSVKRLDEIAVIKGGKQLEKEEIYPVGSYPVFGGNGIQGFSSRSTHAGFVIAFGRVGAYCGAIHWALNGAWLNNNSSSVVPSEYDALVLQHLVGFDFGPLRGGAAQPFISNGALAGVKLLMPTKAIAEQFCDVVGPMRQLQDTITRSIRNLRATRDLLLPKLISGEVDLSAIPKPDVVTR
jgi:type I restriction enzyme S subunit